MWNKREVRTPVFFPILRVNLQAFFTFCAGHVLLLRHLSERTGELPESEVLTIIRQHAAAHDELPETTWRRLREYQVLVPSEPGSDNYLLAEPVSSLMDYLLNEANPATPQIVKGFVESLETLNGQLRLALAKEDVVVVGLAFTEITQTLRRIHAVLEETHKAILAEVARYKTERQRVSAREKFRRIVYWMERYVDPMVEIVRTDGPLRGTFDETERLLRQAREQALFNDHPALERNLRFLRLVGTHALRLFLQSRKEIQPLYESLRRSSMIAEGAARALEKLQNDGLNAWGAGHLIGISALRFQNVPGDAAIALALQRVIDHPPASAPLLDMTSEQEAPEELLRRHWLDSLPEAVAGELPVADLLEWLVQKHPDQSTGSVLAGMGRLVFDERFKTEFTEAADREYSTADGIIRAHPVHLKAP